MREAAAQVLSEMPEQDRTALYCRYASYFLTQMRKLDKLYTSAVQASMQQAGEMKSDFRVMLIVISACKGREQVSVRRVRDEFHDCCTVLNANSYHNQRGSAGS